MKKIFLRLITFLSILGAGIWIGNQGIKLIWGKAELNTKLSTIENKDVSLDDLMGIYLSDTNKNANSSELTFEIESDQEITLGKFEKFNIQLNAHEDFTQSSITVTIDAASINTGNNMRDEHLLEEDFFHTEKFPLIKFTTNAISHLPQIDSIDYVSTGKLSMLGVQKYIDIQFNLKGTGKNEADQEIAIFNGEFSFDRTKYGMPKDESIANVVKVKFTTELIKQ